MRLPSGSTGALSPAAYGHFGRTEPEFTWEATDKADALRSAVGAETREAVTV